ncbi:hypothetical protein MP228_001897 [Amoeboaphelidium protococcarum]|nr:hypothetical protein MP228_001897 [Amoeboaphelidium protococcarum]
MCEMKIKISVSATALTIPPEYIQPSCHDFLITDITEENLRETAKSLDVEYLGVASFPRRFPAIGNIVGGSHRLMISLVCRRQSQQEAPAVNVVFLVNTGSPVSYLSKRAMKALMGHCENVPQMLYVQVHNERVTEFHLSPPDSHFEDDAFGGLTDDELTQLLLGGGSTSTQQSQLPFQQQQQQQQQSQPRQQQQSSGPKQKMNNTLQQSQLAQSMTGQNQLLRNMNNQNQQLSQLGLGLNKSSGLSDLQQQLLLSNLLQQQQQQVDSGVLSTGQFQQQQQQQQPLSQQQLQWQQILLKQQQQQKQQALQQQLKQQPQLLQQLLQKNQQMLQQNSQSGSQKYQQQKQKQPPQQQQPQQKQAQQYQLLQQQQQQFQQQQQQQQKQQQPVAKPTQSSRNAALNRALEPFTDEEKRKIVAALSKLMAHEISKEQFLAHVQEAVGVQGLQQFIALYRQEGSRQSSSSSTLSNGSNTSDPQLAQQQRLQSQSQQSLQKPQQSIQQQQQNSRLSLNALQQLQQQQQSGQSQQQLLQQMYAQMPQISQPAQQQQQLPQQQQSQAQLLQKQLQYFQNNPIQQRTLQSSRQSAASANQDLKRKTVDSQSEQQASQQSSSTSSVADQDEHPSGKRPAAKKTKTVQIAPVPAQPDAFTNGVDIFKLDAGSLQDVIKYAGVDLKEESALLMKDLDAQKAAAAGRRSGRTSLTQSPTLKKSKSQQALQQSSSSRAVSLEVFLKKAVAMLGLSKLDIDCQDTLVLGLEIYMQQLIAATIKASFARVEAGRDAFQLELVDGQDAFSDLPAKYHNTRSRIGAVKRPLVWLEKHYRAIDVQLTKTLGGSVSSEGYDAWMQSGGEDQMQLDTSRTLTGSLEEMDSGSQDAMDIDVQQQQQSDQPHGDQVKSKSRPVQSKKKEAPREDVKVRAKMTNVALEAAGLGSKYSWMTSSAVNIAPATTSGGNSDASSSQTNLAAPKKDLAGFGLPRPLIRQKTLKGRKVEIVDLEYAGKITGLVPRRLHYLFEG